MGTAVRRAPGQKVIWLACVCLLALGAPTGAAEEIAPNVLCRTNLAPERRQALSEQLRAITGWPRLDFDADGRLRFGNAPPSGGSPTARALLSSAQKGRNLILIEDASGSADVVFARVVEGRWKKAAAGAPPAFFVQVDFSDFSHVMGDREALASFNAGWAVLHELDHVVHDSVDPAGPGAAGSCEGSINLMRRECGLAERAEYFYAFMPGADHGDFRSRFVRLPFDRAVEKDKRKRYWLYWDASLTGGSSLFNQAAAR